MFFKFTIINSFEVTDEPEFSHAKKTLVKKQTKRFSEDFKVTEKSSARFSESFKNLPLNF